MKPSKDKLFIVRKCIKAPDAASAIKLDRTTPVHDVWVDDEWKKSQANSLESAIGFNMQARDDF